MEEYKIPQEHQSLPPEHTLPEEFSAAKPVQAEKKKSTSRRWMAMIAATFMTMQLMFTYFVPPTTPDNSGPLPTVPGQSSGNGFTMRAMANHVDDTYLEAGLQIAGEYFADMDYIRASLKMMDAVCEFSMDYGNASLENVAYCFHNSSIADFDAAAESDFYFYFDTGYTTRPNDAGELQRHDVIFSYIVSFEEKPNGTYYRTIEAVWEQSDIMAYGMSYDWLANIYYQVGVLDDSGNSTDFVRTSYEATNVTLDPQVDNIYGAFAFERTTGPVGNFTFLNGSETSSFLEYDDAQRDFVMDEYMRDCVFKVHWLTPDGRLDLDHDAAMDATTGLGNTTLEDFRNNDALDVLAEPNAVTLKAAVNRDHELIISGVTLDEPLFPLDIETAINIKNFIKEAPEQNEPNIPDEDFHTNLQLKELDDSDLDPMKELLEQTCDTFFSGDYVSAAMQCRVALDRFAADHSSNDLYNTAFVWKDGILSAFDGQDLRDGSGVYVFFYVTDEKYVGKESNDIYTYPFLNMTLLVSNKNGNKDYIRMMHMKTERFFIDMPEVNGLDVTYLETTFDNGYYANDVELINFRAALVYNWNESVSKDETYGGAYIRGDIKQDHVCGDMQYIEYGCVLSTDQTRYERDPYSVPIKIKLDNNGCLDIDGMRLLHYKEADGQSYSDLTDAFSNDYDCPGYVYSYEQYGLLMLVHPEDSKQDYWREFVETDPLFTTGRSIEFWRMLQQHMN